MQIIKRDGTVEPFSEEKVRQSMIKSGVDDLTINLVIKKILSRKYNKINTEKLYRLVYKLVSKHYNKYTASIYSLKQALTDLGPTGYVFEDFIARVFEELGKKVKTRQIYKSMCISHELDVVGDDFFVECKYHNRGGTTTGIKDVMYSHARFLDLHHASKKMSYNFNTLFIATNTRFSEESIKYASYWKIKLLGWKYPIGKSLSKIIDTNKLYPVTLLPSVSKNLFRKLSQNNIILVKEFNDKSDKYLLSKGFSNDEINKMRLDWDRLLEAAKKIK